MVEDSLRIWQLNRHRADNISAIVVFLDDEFLPQPEEDDEDTESVASSEADTIIITRDDDTPPMSGSENLSSLVRQIALPFGGQSNGTNCTAAITNSSSSTSDISSLDDGEASRSLRNGSPAGDGVTSGHNHKRKLPYDEASSPTSSPSKHASKSKKAKHHNITTNTVVTPSSPPLNSSEDSHQCTNVITVLSAESLSDLQLDEEDVGFVDEERSRKLTSSSTKSLNHQRLAIVPVLQAAK